MIGSQRLVLSGRIGDSATFATLLQDQELRQTFEQNITLAKALCRLIGNMVASILFG